MSPPRLLQIVGPNERPRPRRTGLDPRTLGQARAILDDVEREGEAAVRSHSERLGDLKPGGQLLYLPKDLGAARDRLPQDTRSLLERTAERIRTFAAAQRRCLTDLTIPIPGGHAGHTCIPVDVAGCYAPGGRFPLPSSVLMTVITARAAGVSTIWAASPRPPDVTLAAAAIAGADGLLAAGGAQAIGAFACGAGLVPPCDVIVGPGNRWVTAAKHLVSDRVGIDMLAGPSELVVLADDSADPRTIAADLLAQAEHDSDAVPILVTTSRTLAEAVNTELSRQIESLPTRGVAAKAIENGRAFVVPDLDAAISTCDALAPEHLHVVTRDAQQVASRVRHCGGLFIGPSAAEVLGDYGAGPNHVLPTGGTARFRAGLSVFSFLRPRTWLHIDNAAASDPLVCDAVSLARAESLEGHARAGERRAPWSEQGLESPRPLSRKSC
jgi:phosphoribosyl-ATP pyrophosphohydrolase/phosphoribosyl-AMP cyclohydrolase/histidinol dehydrogenase